MSQAKARNSLHPLPLKWRGFRGLKPEFCNSRPLCECECLRPRKPVKAWPCEGRYCLSSMRGTGMKTLLICLPSMNNTL
jgi:hypothetical protein